MYTQTNVGLLPCVGSGSNVDLPLEGENLAIGQLT